MASQVAITSHNNGKTLSVRLGDSLLLQLPENPSTGYRWAFDRLDDTILAIVDSSFVGEGPHPGAGGLATWVVQSKALGKTALRLKRWRHWQGDASVVERFSVTVEIKAP